VVLEGKVQSWAEKALCEEVVKGVKGVGEIVNNIIVDYQKERTDYEIKTEIERRLEIDVLVNEALVDVDVVDGGVIVTGSVGSVAEKVRVRTHCWVAGVNSVDISGLKVELWAKDRMQRTKSYIWKSDEDIQKAVEDAFLCDTRVLSFQPDIDVDAGIVTLTGEVSNLAAKKVAGEDALNTTGVWKVNNYLHVRPKELLPDVELANRIRQAIDRDPYVERHEIDVTVRNGKAYLYGTVDSKFERRQTYDVTSRIKGVIDVQNNIVVHTGWTNKSDREIEEVIEKELYWNPYIDGDRITVRVTDGKAVLSGTVDNWFEYRHATGEAWEGGARTVDNNLIVKNTP
jgi:osmotically-inducible protein OsmY